MAMRSGCGTFRGVSPMLFPPLRTRENYLDAFWSWVGLLANDDYEAAAKALHPSSPKRLWTGERLQTKVTTFFGGDEPWTVVVPNDRLIAVVNDACDWTEGWFMAQIPLTTRPQQPKADDIPLMGLATSFFVREIGGMFALEHEIFHA